MAAMRKDWTLDLAQAVREGLVIPAHPLALGSDRQLNEDRQRLLTRYYIASGAGGIAIGVHSTQFEIRDPKHGLYERVLELAAEEVNAANLTRPFLKVAGICGPTEQALEETATAVSLGYEAGLLSLGGLADWTETKLIEHAARVAEQIPVIGFYLQPAVGGRVLSYDFWREFAEIPGVMAIKMAPFNRYQTIDVVRAVCASSRRDEISLYTGNDDNIINDLLTKYRFTIDGQIVEKRIVGGLLGQWAVWTYKAVEMLRELKEVRQSDAFAQEWMTRNIELTDSNGIVFDVSHQFHGCIPGIHEVLRRQGIMEGIWCLNPDEHLSPGQSEELDRIAQQYAHLADDAFVAEHLSAWKSGLKL